jgi:Carboxypeptidase regulatory-like domain
MTTDPLTPSSTDSQSAIALADWVNETRTRTATEGVPAPKHVRPVSRDVPKWMLLILLLTVGGVAWMAWSSRPPAGTSVEGLIRDIHGKPVTGAVVFLVADPKTETHTSAAGSFQLTGLPCGKHTLIVGLDGMGQEYSVWIRHAARMDLGDLVFRVAPLEVRLTPGGEIAWGRD